MPIAPWAPEFWEEKRFEEEDGGREISMEDGREEGKRKWGRRRKGVKKEERGGRKRREKDGGQAYEIVILRGGNNRKMGWVTLINEKDRKQRVTGQERAKSAKRLTRKPFICRYRFVHPSPTLQRYGRLFSSASASESPFSTASRTSKLHWPTTHGRSWQGVDEIVSLRSWTAEASERKKRGRLTFEMILESVLLFVWLLASRCGAVEALLDGSAWLGFVRARGGFRLRVGEGVGAGHRGVRERRERGVGGIARELTENGRIGRRSGRGWSEGGRVDEAGRVGDAGGFSRIRGIDWREVDAVEGSGRGRDGRRRGTGCCCCTGVNRPRGGIVRLYHRRESWSPHWLMLPLLQLAPPRRRQRPELILWVGVKVGRVMGVSGGGCEMSSFGRTRAVGGGWLGWGIGVVGERIRV
jgi:hypothetical protein